MNWKTVKLPDGVTAAEADRVFGERKKLLPVRGRNEGKFWFNFLIN
jgi:hypothetical protein